MKIPFFGRLLIGLAMAAAVVGAYKTWEHHVYQQGVTATDDKWKKKEVEIKAGAAEKLAEATAEAQRKERALNLVVLRQTEQRIQENANHEKRVTALTARVLAGDERLRIAINTRSLPQRPAGADPAAGAGSGGETRADLMPGTTERIFRIAGGIARLVRDYNAVVDAYNRARETCNAGVDQPSPVATMPPKE